ncbi:hypothetical protein [Streptomyces sp. XY332]|uniref:hypothetical protein n=1 Tax=Streptomyces sp. XY332 TaxID=1415561 RepID=UPI0006B1FB2B|nr:hypothetical protein [Streptomyces sp. XY332]KOY55981.1 hypothetical protein ADK59_21580 [Streptomyces sp. XY332]
MTEPIFYIDRSDILDGSIEEVRVRMCDLAAFAEEREPQLIAYHFYVDESESTMSVIAVHPDTASMELHLEIGGPKFRGFGPFIRMRSIDLYGRPSPAVVNQLRQKAEMLGGAPVTVHTIEAGFSHLNG